MKFSINVVASRGMCLMMAAADGVTVLYESEAMYFVPDKKHSKLLHIYKKSYVIFIVI